MPRKSIARGQVLVGVIMLLLILLILVPALVEWVQIDSKASVGDAKKTTAFNLAEAAVERGAWKVKSSTGIWQQVTSGGALAGYNFDVTYTDVPGGTYRIKVTDIGTSSVTIVGEGRDNQSQQTRAVSAVFQNQSVYSPLMASQGVNWSQGMCPMWGPIMSQGNINLLDDYVANWYFPRKYAKGVVVGTAANPRDTNGLTPPNTDGVEWWSDYQYVPDLPILDFATLRSSAAATGTLNVYGCESSATYTVPGTTATAAGPAPWDSTPGGCYNTGSHSLHFSASFNHPNGAGNQPNNTYVWYYDHDVILGGENINGPPLNTGTGLYGIGLHGSLIVRGNLTLDATGDYNYTGTVPVNAWAEYDRLTKTTYDTAASGEYPADNGYHQSLPTWRFGTDSACIPATSGTFFGYYYNGCGWINTVGIRGFTYVGGNLNITTNGFMDFNGAVWVNGSVVSAGTSPIQFCGIYFDDQLKLPTLNVVLTRQSWKEISPSGTPWP
ncbi:MAG: hypothetical protein HKL90_02200 [Elusimicrobia bacterium]|nr:hypothetical protein [Elusimicrobiota bacterium]